MIKEMFCPRLAPGEVKDSTSNPSAVSLLADRGPDSHPLRGSFQSIVFRLVMWFLSGQFSANGFLTDTLGVHEASARKAF